MNKLYNNSMRNYRREIEIALAGGAPKNVPFTIYDMIIPKGLDLSSLQERGLGICARRDVYRKLIKNVIIKSVIEPDGTLCIVWETPIGRLHQRYRTDAYHPVSSERPSTKYIMNNWNFPPYMAPVEHLIKRRDDYRIAEFIIKNTHYEPIYDEFLEEHKKTGNSGYTLAQTCYSPLTEIQVVWLGQERFCYEIYDNEDAIMHLYELMKKSHLDMYEVVANSPADHILYGGNIVPAMVGPERVKNFILPLWNTFADRLHDKGKKLGVHFDADNLLIMDIIKESSLDFIEAFTPPPDCSVTVSQARIVLSDSKRLWINFPSSVHVRSNKVIRDTTLKILEDAGDRKGFLLGITEDIPVMHIYRSLSVILDVIANYDR
jgi:uroporphyrinogen-III decarboxylase